MHDVLNQKNEKFFKSTKWAILLISAWLSIEGSISVNAAEATNFLTDSSLTGNLYFWNRDRDRKDINTGSYEANLRHSTLNANLDFQSGYIHDIFGIELGGYTSFEFNHGGPAYPNEIGFSDAKQRWDEKYTGDKNGISFYKIQANIKMDNFWAKGGYIQPSGQTLLSPHWSFLPGTYQGIEIGTHYDFGNYGRLAFSYMWANRYKAPWYVNLDEFREKDQRTKISYLHSAGFKYDIKNNLVLEGAFGQSKKYLNQYFGKLSYNTPVFDNTLDMSYQFYGSKDQRHDSDNVYEGLAWLQAVTLKYQTGPVDWRLEGTAVKAKGQGYFLQRMTPSWASSNGRLDIWWNGRSDFNADGERSIFAEISYDLGVLNLPGWKIGTSYIYAWNAKPGSVVGADMSRRIRESAWNFDVSYRVQQGYFKDTAIALHFTDYNNHSNIPSWGGGYGNMFQDERDVKFMIIMPFKLR